MKVVKAIPLAIVLVLAFAIPARAEMFVHTVADQRELKVDRDAVKPGGLQITSDRTIFFKTEGKFLNLCRLHDQTGRTFPIKPSHHNTRHQLVSAPNGTIYWFDGFKLFALDKESDDPKEIPVKDLGVLFTSPSSELLSQDETTIERLNPVQQTKERVAGTDVDKFVILDHPRPNWRSTVSTFNGDGPALKTNITPTQTLFSPSGELFFIDRSYKEGETVNDGYPHPVLQNPIVEPRIRKLNPKTGQIETVVGTGSRDFNGDNLGTETNIDPQQIFFSRDGTLYFIDHSLNEEGLPAPRIRMWDQETKQVKTVVGSGSKQFTPDGQGTAMGTDPVTIAFSPANELHYIDRSQNEQHQPVPLIRKLVRGTGLVETVAGTGDGTFNGDHGAKQTNINPTEIVFDPDGNLFFTEKDQLRVLTSTEDHSLAVPSLVQLAGEKVYDRMTRVKKRDDLLQMPVDDLLNLKEEQIGTRLAEEDPKTYKQLALELLKAGPDARKGTKVGSKMAWLREAKAKYRERLAKEAQDQKRREAEAAGRQAQ
jgi:hypothetical protein